MKDFPGKIAFITGGANGAGFGQAQVFGRAGCRVVIADIRGDAIEEALGRLRGEGIEAHGIQLDLTDRAAYARAADEVEQVFGGPPQLLFNTAGVNTFGPTEASTYEDYDWVMGVNFGGVVNGMVTFVPRMIKAGREGHIVSVSSMAGFHGTQGAAIYAASKAAVINLMESYRLSLAQHGIGVSVLCPANINTNIARSTDLRPAHLAHSGYVVDDDTIRSLESIYRHGMDPVDLAGHVKRAIEENQLYILPYPEAKARVEEHFRTILDAWLPMEADPEGARKRTEALENWARARGDMMTRRSEQAEA